MRSWKLTCCAVLIGLLPVVAVAAPGDIDPTFGNAGAVAPPYGTYTRYSSYSDGRLLAYKSIADSTVLRVRRLTVEGKPDPDWGTAGEALADLASLPTALRPIYTPSSVLAAGNADGSVILTYDRLVLRLLPNGSLDRNFAGIGYIDRARSAYDPVVSVVAAQSDGSTLIGLTCNTCDTYGLAENVIRVLPSGSSSLLTLPNYANSSIGLLNVAMLLYEAIGDWVLTMRRLADGRTVVVGRLGVARFNVDGSLDTTFARQGVVRIDLPTTALPSAINIAPTIRALTGMGSGSYMRSAVITPEGKVILNVRGPIARNEGEGTSYQRFGSILIRLDASGEFESGFGDKSDGIFQPDWATALGPAYARIDDDFSVDASPAGNLLLSGSGPNGAFLWRLTPDGRNPSTGALRGYQASALAGTVLHVRDNGDIVIAVANYNNFSGAGTLLRVGPGAPDSPGLLLVPDVDVSAAEAEASPAGGSTIKQIPVTRLGGSRGTISVDYTTAEGGANPATPGSDFTPVSGRLSWADGETGTQYISVAMIDDATQETAEQFNVNLTNVSGGALLGASTIRVAIAASDVPKMTGTTGAATTTPTSSANATTAATTKGGGGAFDLTGLLWLSLATLGTLRATASGRHHRRGAVAPELTDAVAGCRGTGRTWIRRSATLASLLRPTALTPATRVTRTGDCWPIRACRRVWCSGSGA
jgi:uncharacterized delta-60 repeat protein